MVIKPDRKVVPLSSLKSVPRPTATWSIVIDIMAISLRIKVLKKPCFKKLLLCSVELLSGDKNVLSVILNVLVNII